MRCCDGGVVMVGMGWWMDMDGWRMGMDGVVVNVLKIGYYYYIINVIYFSCAKNVNHSQILGSPDPLFFF